MENNLNKLIEEVKERGTVYNGMFSDLSEMSTYLISLKDEFKSKKVLVFCNSEFLKNIKLIVNKIQLDKSFYDFGVFDNENAYIQDIVDFNLYLDGTRYSFIEKQNLIEDSIWSCVDNDNPKDMLVTLHNIEVKDVEILQNQSKHYLKIEGVLTKVDKTQFTEFQWDEFMDRFIELVEKHNLSFGGGSGLYTEKELENLF